MKTHLAVLVAVCTAAPALAHADEWTHTTEFTGAQSSSIRVVEPEGYTVTVNGKTDTVPAVFNVDNANNYFLVKFASPDGATWEKKIEVKEYRQTVLRVKHAKAGAEPKPDAPKAKAMSYVGTIKNATDKCQADYQMTIKLDFLLGPDVIKSTEVKAGGRANVELVEGQYNIRRYQLDGQEWVFDKTDPWTVKKDGWIYEWGCTTKRRGR